jgi:DNA-binding transcriptional LysR family regulator
MQLDLRTAHRLGDEDAQAADVLLMHGWPEVPPDYVHRQLGLASSLIAAAPEYWRARGLPDTPQALAAHDCLCMRNPFGIVIDLWEFTRGQERCSVKVNGWMLSNAREVMLNAVLRGQGVGRFVEVTMREHVQSGRLVPVLPNWEVQGGPPINLLYRASARHNPRARAFIDFMLQVIKQCEAEGALLAHHPSTERPAWHRRGYGRASAAVRSSR